MGYRFSLDTVNIVANLSFNKIEACYRDILNSDSDIITNFLSFLDQFRKNMFSSEIDDYMETVNKIKKFLLRHAQHYNHRSLSDTNTGDYNVEFLSHLCDLSKIFSRCAIKALLLPPIIPKQRYFNDFMTSSETLQQLAYIHDSDSCLILQPQELPTQLIIFDAFPNFDVALYQADNWPAVLLWRDEKDFSFIPINSEAQLFKLFYMLKKYSNYPLRWFKENITKKENEAIYYFFHLSDLHFIGQDVNSSLTKNRLKSIIEAHISKLELKKNDDLRFIITGDLVDTPSNINRHIYKEFEEYIQSNWGHTPIKVLGNHDINSHGLAFSHRIQDIVSFVAPYPAIEILEKPKIILLLFNSNVNGYFAEGEVGEAQMAEMANKLEQIPNHDQYLLIAVMHHHLLPVPEPNWYERKWYEKFVPRLTDAMLRLRDDSVFINWLNQHNVRYVLHGHKHIPFIGKKENLTVIGCGSSTGKVTHKEEGKTYISYNLLRIREKTMTCTQFAEEVLEAGFAPKDIRVEIN